MANIVISDLRPAGSELFSDSESYLRDLKEQEMMYTAGGAANFSSIMFCGKNCTRQLPPPVAK